MEREIQFKEYLEKKYMELVQRRGRSFSLARMAAEIGLKQGTLSSWINNSRSPDFDNIVKISRYFDDDEPYRIMGYPVPMPEDKQTQQALRAFSRLTESQQQSILKTMRAMLGE